MLETLNRSLGAWWDTVPPDFAFLLALPFGVAALGIVRGGWDTRRRQRRTAGEVDRQRTSSPASHRV